jgi:hypothetical protein
MQEPSNDKNSNLKESIMLLDAHDAARYDCSQRVIAAKIQAKLREQRLSDLANEASKYGPDTDTFTVTVEHFKEEIAELCSLVKKLKEKTK